MIILILLLQAVNISADFYELFQADWAPDHIATQGDQVSLSLDSSTGCGFESKKKYLFGKASAQLKLVQGDSAGTVTAFYMSSEGPNHDELDFEFLGNVTGEPYIVQTNLYVNGTGNREQRHYLWFDPTLDFHTYSFLWNHRSIL
ncbi:xyloglucan endotransglucosylase/hydrolase 9 [Perilla frutescens var. frutescens]|nr:xyloglucan endotransglucosylase/hydrolase 9 [Perilla frutescens var. frutescens]